MTENNITPDISVTFAQNAEILSIAYHGWKIDQSIIPLQFPSQDSLSWLINKLEGYKLCTGTEHSTKNTWIHFVQTWENDHVQNKQCIRSPSCLIIVSDENKEQKCKTCCVYERKTVHNKKSNLAGTTPNNQCDSTDVDEELKTPNPWLQLFNAQQEQNREREKSGRRYHPDIIRWCIEMYARSAAAYNYLRVTEVVVLPSATTLRTYRNMVTPKPGLNQVAIDEIKRLGGNIDAYLTLDEMKIRENLVYRNGKVTGMVDFGDRTSVDKLASHICVIYLRSFHKTISLPLSWFPTTTTPAFQLCSTFWEAVGICESNGVRIHAVVADGASTNRKFFELLAGKFSSDTKEFYGCINSYDTSRKILIFSDFCHLLKTTRNGLYSSKPSGTKYFNKSGKDILWSHIVSLYNLDNATLLSKTRLSNLHMLLNPYNKMKVDIARQTLSHNVACALEDIEGADGTAEFIQLFHKWFTIINSKRPIKDLKDENLLWLKDHFIPYLMEWRSEVTNMHPGEEKRILAKQTFEGLLFSTNNILPLTKQLLHYIDGVPLGNLTQDCLEAMFGNLRQYMHRNTNPDISQVGYGINALSKRRIISKIKGGNTTGSHGAINAWTKVCNDPLGKRKKKT